MPRIIDDSDLSVRGLRIEDLRGLRGLPFARGAAGAGGRRSAAGATSTTCSSRCSSSDRVTGTIWLSPTTPMQTRWPPSGGDGRRAPARRSRSRDAAAAPANRPRASSTRTRWTRSLVSTGPMAPDPVRRPAGDHQQRARLLRATADARGRLRPPGAAADETSLRNFTSDNVEVSLDSITSTLFSDYLDSVPLPAMLSMLQGGGVG